MAEEKQRKTRITQLFVVYHAANGFGRDAARWIPAECQKDSLGKDGLGLPGSHGCGAHQISASSFYVG
jgi:hypothetical protein